MKRCHNRKRATSARLRHQPRSGPEIRTGDRCLRCEADKSEINQSLLKLLIKFNCCCCLERLLSLNRLLFFMLLLLLLLLLKRIHNLLIFKQQSKTATRLH